MDITFDDFFEIFRPIANRKSDAVGPGFDGRLFGIRPNGANLAELQTINLEQPRSVWSVVDCGGKVIFFNGMQGGFPIAFVVTEVACPVGLTIRVVDDVSLSHRYKCFARFNGVSPSIQAFMDATHDEEFETYPPWINRMLSQWSLETGLPKTNMNAWHDAHFDEWLVAHVEYAYLYQQSANFDSMIHPNRGQCV